MNIKNKLVRDLIPDLIRKNCQLPMTRVLGDEDYKQELDLKLQEEVGEYLQDQTVEELADILEVVYAIAETKGYSNKKLEELRSKKALERGSFQDRIFLIGVS